MVSLFFERNSGSLITRVKIFSLILRFGIDLRDFLSYYSDLDKEKKSFDKMFQKI